jgi:hypothetical protein
MYLAVLMWTDVSDEHFTSTFKLGNQRNKKATVPEIVKCMAGQLLLATRIPDT